jgi:diaminopropionate ammonia-lyase
MTGGYPFRFVINPRHGVPGVVILPASGFRRARAQITSWAGYAPTPLHDLPAVAATAGVAQIRIKDEGGRFGLGSFKALGGAYAVANLLSGELSRRGVANAAGAGEFADGRYRDATRAITVTCATDGNHGRSVAWGAARFHCRCVIFVHATVSQPRVDAIAAFGAEVRRVAGNYDDAVRQAATTAGDNGWFVISDTSYAGYTEVPRAVMQGYRVMADEAADQWTGPPPTHVFIQAGVGGAAAAVSVHMRERFDPTPTLIVVEPERAACLLASVEQGAPAVVTGDLETIMAGLACGEPSVLAWQELERAATAFMAIPDQPVVDSMRLLATEGLVIGESGAAGLAGLLLASAAPATRERFGLDGDSRILLFGTEGATDVGLYEHIVSGRLS